MDQRKSLGMLCIDLSNAFDGVHHDHLLAKVSEAGFPLYLLKITESFLSSRRFMVYIGNTASGFRNLTVGVPQGSVLSLTMFNVYIHDAPVPPASILAEFADDSAYLTAFHRTPTILRRLETAASRAVRCFGELGIPVNGPKSAAMIFFTQAG